MSGTLVHRVHPVVQRLLGAPTLLFRAHLGGLLGGRFLMVTHVGRRSGREYQTVLEVVGRLPARDEYVVMAGLGHTADWLRNIQAAGAREVAVGRRRFRPTDRLLDETEAVAILAGYEERNRLIAPVVRAVLSRLVGWRYTGAGAERHRLVRQLPMVAFAPSGRPDSFTRQP